MKAQENMIDQRRPIIMANWKLNGDIDLLCKSVSSFVQHAYLAEVVVCPPYLYIRDMLNFLRNSPIKVGGQNISKHDSGAFTGETSARMLKEAGCRYCIIGHSERREIFGENNISCQMKIARALEANLTPVYCIGESQQEYEQGLTEQVLSNQLREALEDMDLTNKNLCIAYEPVWAIGTGKAATPEIAQEVHAFIRKQLTDMYGPETANTIRIMYGGSANKNNAHLLLEQADIDGLLVGGASLDPEHFSTICRSVEQTTKSACL
ncbi:triosephosphate isomerase [Catenovulum agarivorans DS-2]|uniref:Triosephosphate isomerase n=1 Tax=Catenovulum agarivorans DS-2 TaxID=1328313 RepID=W7QTR4_9ALTE|nr:triose-phosphate isomerase [Catenovulum agarivorans]EWH08820.1 triosephosphate isomerase [Catenovulum agarivorans DS-2]